MKQAVVVIGMGEMGGVFARGFLKCGHPVYPATRRTDLQQLSEVLPEPALVLLAVGEKDLHCSLDQIPAAWRGRLALLQNELLPGDWQQHEIPAPTVISVWFEKKKGQDYKVLVPSPIYGPLSTLLKDALASLDIPSFIVEDEDSLLFQLVRKNVYILTTNISGLVTGGTVDTLWHQHQELARAVAADIMDIQDWLTGKPQNRDALIDGMVEAIKGDLEHKCMGRSAPARLQTALGNADKAGLAVAKLREIAAQSTKA